MPETDQDLVDLTQWLANIKNTDEFVVGLKQLLREYNPEQKCLSFRICSKILNLAEEGKGLHVEFADDPENKVIGVLWGWNDNKIYLMLNGSQSTNGIAYSSIRRFWLEV